MSDQDPTIFNSEEPPVAPTTPEPQVPAAPTIDYSAMLGDIRDDGGNQKYSDVETALKSINFAAEHIKTLENENAQYKDDLTKVSAAEDLVAQVQAASQTQTGTSEGLSIQAITEMMSQQINLDKQNTVSKMNQASIVASLTEKFGDKAEEMYVKKGAELGLGSKTLDDIAGKSPEAVLAWFGVEASTTNPPQLKSEELPGSLQKPQGLQTQRKSVMGMGSSEAVLGEWNRIKKDLEAEGAFG